MPATQPRISTGHPLAETLIKFWDEGRFGTSLEEACRYSNISQESLFEEFGSEDALRAAVLELYRTSVFMGLSEILLAERNFEEVLRTYLTALIQHGDQTCGCLLAEYRLIQQSLGHTSRESVSQFTDSLRSLYKAWLSRAQVAGDIRDDIDLETAIEHLDAQIMIASIKARRGMPKEQIRRNVELSLWALRPHLSL